MAGPIPPEARLPYSHQRRGQVPTQGQNFGIWFMVDGQKIYVCLLL